MTKGVADNVGRNEIPLVLTAGCRVEGGVIDKEGDFGRMMGKVLYRWNSNWFWLFYVIQSMCVLFF